MRGLPHRDIAHHGGRARQVGSDSREVEGAYGIDEALQRTVLGPVPDAGLGDRLFPVDVLGEVRPEAEEVDDLARRIDFSLKRVLALPEHRGGVELRSARTREQVGDFEKDRHPVLPTHHRPFAVGRVRRTDGSTDFIGTGHVGLRDHMPMIVGHHHVDRVAGPDLFSTCLLYTSPSPRDLSTSRMPSSA